MLRAARTAAALLLLLLLAPPPASCDGPRPPPNGPKRVDPAWRAITGATVHTAPGAAVANATVEIRDGRIVRVTTERPPSGPETVDATGLHLYAGFLDAFVEVDAPPPDRAAATTHWNTKVTPERAALLGPGLPEAEAEALRRLGFCAAALSPRGGIFRGRGAVVSLARPSDDPSAVRPPVHLADAFETLAFEVFEDGYPDSQMGAIALVRQTLLDRGPVPAPLPLLFETSDELEVLRAAKVAREFGAEPFAVGSGTEFRRLEALRAAGPRLVVPLAFPEKPDVTTIGAAEAAELRAMMTWEQAPSNPRRLDAAGLRVALTSSKLRERAAFRDRLLACVRAGLDPERALAMLTTAPAEMLGVGDRLGTVEAGRIANLVLADGPVFSPKSRILEVWIDGRRHELEPRRPRALRGEWALSFDPPLAAEATFRFGEEGGVEVREGEAKQEAQHVRFSERGVRFAFEHAPFGEPGVFQVEALLEGDALLGTVVRANGERLRFRAAPRPAAAPAPPGSPEAPPPPIPDLPGLPFGPYALAAPPEQPEVVLVRGATIWTCGPQGIVANGVLVVRRGKIESVGTELPSIPGAVVVDAAGKHVTPGIIDCHSHTGISKGVNESGQAVTAEVRIADVTNPDAIGWYRELAGGVTCVNSLHGSANPIGGQNCVNKIRWGAVHPDEMHFEGAPPGIKFALGENVKQSNWGDRHVTRYPQTRMGVETLIRDRFLAAREHASRPGAPRDLELEALAEVLRGERLVHCHSYRQDEILMLCRVAAEFGFRIGTFQHVLEGYKVADAVRDHSRGGSSFTDWWAYKVEVQDAIPENGAIMHEVGVCVSFNSDSDELARRMNVEAAKAVKYGGVPREEALKFVTLNPARQLGIESRVGSLEPGKDADFSIWSADPLSTLARCESTWIDGREYFSIAKDRAHRERIRDERRRLVQKILAAKEEDGKKGGEKGKERPVSDEYRARLLELARKGLDPFAARCGECGCTEGR